MTSIHGDIPVRDGTNYGLGEHGYFLSKNKVFVLITLQNMGGHSNVN